MKEKRSFIPRGRRVYGSKFGNETHFLSFTAIVATKNWTDGSNFHVRNAMTTRIKCLVGIVGRNCTTMLTKPCPDPIPDYLGRYIRDCVGTASCCCGEVEQFINYVNNFHPALQFTWEISETQCIIFRYSRVNQWQ